MARTNGGGLSLSPTSVQSPPDVVRPMYANRTNAGQTWEMVWVIAMEDCALFPFLFSFFVSFIACRLVQQVHQHTQCVNTTKCRSFFFCWVVFEPHVGSCMPVLITVFAFKCFWGWFLWSCHAFNNLRWFFFILLLGTTIPRSPVVSWRIGWCATAHRSIDFQGFASRLSSSLEVGYAAVVQTKLFQECSINCSL